MATKTQIREVEQYVARWKDALQLSTWRVRIFHMAEPYTDDPEISAATEVWYRYYEVRIHVYPPFWLKTPEDREHTIVHELVHAILGELCDLVNEELVTKKHLEDVQERTTELVTRAAVALRQGGRK